MRSLSAVRVRRLKPFTTGMDRRRRKVSSPADARIHHPELTVGPVDLEELVLAYLERPTVRPPTHLTGSRR